MVHAAQTTPAPMPCPAPGCGESLLLEPWWSLIPIAGLAAMAHVHSLCGLAWTRKSARNRALHGLAQLAAAVLARDEDIVPTIDEGELVLTVEMRLALGAQTDRITVTPGDDGVLRFWWLSPRPCLRPEPPQMTPAPLCSQPVEMAARIVDRLVLGITTSTP